MYKKLFSDEQKIAYVSDDFKSRSKLIHTGIYDSYILCHRCDNELISSWETYASKLLYNGNFKKEEQIHVENRVGHDGLEYVNVKNVNYKKFKLFLLSILWRAHVSKHPFFSEVNLGSSEQKLKRMLLEEKPGRECDFEIILIYPKTSSDIPDYIIAKPRIIRKNGNTFYVFVISEVIYLFNISAFNRQPVFSSVSVKESNELNVVILQDMFANKFFDSVMGIKLRVNS
ncbi:MAG: hypothetical protein LPJ89_11290 [Hymenobacteraceae bacterium]|nr:hypothetical protein [Hymenobacteraceae bacterium]MDX5395852.1 hypothetical protein [Hymenobacteraceae bacterium]MDX5444351.1 hypothetical protein [Hymenobacteraceae bacterium]MDX5511907.1 hypothetical protein [Hymenobacteraceae bacterium]